MKNIIKKYGVPIIIAIVLILFVVLSLLMKDSTPKGFLGNKDFDSWVEDTKKEEYVVTIIGQTGCGHCINFKPVVKKVFNENDFKVYWFEANQMSNERYQTLTGAYDLPDYGGTPYTFITYNGELVDYYSMGEMSKEALEEFLTKNNVIGENAGKPKEETPENSELNE